MFNWFFCLHLVVDDRVTVTWYSRWYLMTFYIKSLVVRLQCIDWWTNPVARGVLYFHWLCEYLTKVCLYVFDINKQFLMRILIRPAWSIVNWWPNRYCRILQTKMSLNRQSTHLPANVVIDNNRVSSVIVAMLAIPLTHYTLKLHSGVRENTSTTVTGWMMDGWLIRSTCDSNFLTGNFGYVFGKV